MRQNEIKEAQGCHRCCQRNADTDFCKNKFPGKTEEQKEKVKQYHIATVKVSYLRLVYFMMLRFIGGVLTGIFIAERYNMPKMDAIMKKAAQEIDKWSKN